MDILRMSTMYMPVCGISIDTQAIHLSHDGLSFDIYTWHTSICGTSMDIPSFAILSTAICCTRTEVFHILLPTGCL